MTPAPDASRRARASVLDLSRRCRAYALGRAPSAAFTLIELLIGLAVAAVLATIAFAGYDEHLRSARRAEARRTLLEAALVLEQNFAQTARYDRDPGGAAIAAGVVPAVPPFPAQLANVTGPGGNPALYELRFEEAPTPDAFTLVASRTASGPMASDACGDFALDHTGRRRILRAAAGARADECWERGRP
jgi:type IV pilus assembly protein PilE